MKLEKERQEFVSRAMAIIRGEDSYYDLDHARVRVKAGDLAAFAEEYESLETWEHKTALVIVIEDHHDEVLAPLMRDVLRVPDNGEDSCWLVRAIALCFFDADFDAFDTYWNDRDLIRRRTAERLAEFEEEDGGNS